MFYVFIGFQNVNPEVSTSKEGEIPVNISKTIILEDG